jgi:hypothetical protein
MTQPLATAWTGFRIVCWAGEDYAGGARAAALGETKRPAEADELVRLFATPEPPAWRIAAAVGGAGDQWLAVLDVSLTALSVLLQSPEQVAKAWSLFRRLLARLRRQRRVGWHAAPEIALLRCLAAVRRRIRNPVFSAETIRIIEDGRQTAMWSDLPRGLHIVLVPELRTRRTFVFAVDEKPQIVGEMVISRLTADASEHVPARASRGRKTRRAR